MKDLENIVKELARKWYKIIGFSSEHDGEFNKLLEEETGLKPMRFEDYDVVGNSKNKGLNLIMFLYFCEELSKKYEDMKIPREILLNTIADFRTSAVREYSVSGKIGLANTWMQSKHLSMNLFRLGRLEFCKDKIPVDIVAKGLKKGDNVIDIHIPAGGPLTPEVCARDFKISEEFFMKYFPEYNYDYYMCYSWLLDENLKNFLDENSNILKFQKNFETVYYSESDSILHFMFKYGFTDREEIRNCPATTDFAKKVKEFALSGGKFYNVIGICDRKKLFERNG